MMSGTSENLHKSPRKTSGDGLERKSKGEGSNDSSGGKRSSEYKRQLVEKQKLKKKVYNLREKQFRRFFDLAVADKSGETGDNLLVYLERRLDNIVYRLKMALSRKHARQMIVHGHFLLNGKPVKSPSLIVKAGDVISLVEKTKQASTFKAIFEKRMNSGVKTPDWLELSPADGRGVILKLPSRVDIPTKSETSLIVELYSK